MLFKFPGLPFFDIFVDGREDISLDERVEFGGDGGGDRVTHSLQSI